MRRLLLALSLLLCLSAAAPALELTTRLVDAQPGSWTRRLSPNSHSRTQYVKAVTPEAVTLQILRHHNGYVVDNKIVTIPRTYLLEHAANPDSPDATDGRIEHHGTTYAVRIVKGRVEESEGMFYISDAIPASGVVKIDLIHGSGNVYSTLWTDEYGTSPDKEILDAGPGKNSNAEYGIPEK